MTTLCHRLSRHSPHYQNPLFGDAWTEKEAEVKEYVYRNVIKDGCIKKGTTLYHGTTSKELVLDDHRATFFGLEPMISLWYTLEEAEKKREIRRGYVYKFRVTEPIRIERYIERIREHPGEECCVHPQVVLRGYDNYNACMGPFDLSIEVTLLAEQRKSLKITRVYEVDLEELQKYVEYPVTRLRLVKDRNQIKIKFLA
jgi:hypothetical protein